MEGKLKEVETKKLFCVGKSISIKEVIDLSNAFIDYSLQKKDYRFLNASLKLNDRIRKEVKEKEIIEKIENKEIIALNKLKKNIGI